jgi:cell division cycle 20-like protein 1 (cofactor of APC complex)
MTPSLFGPGRPTRKISNIPYKVLDAPDLRDDFYLNLLDWSATNMLTVSLATSVYLWSGESGKVDRFCTVGTEGGPDDFYASLQWNADGTTLATGTQSGMLELWDAPTGQKIAALRRHANRIGCLSWNQNQPNFLISGSRDMSLMLWDFRTPERNTIEFKKAHRLEVCGLQWAPHDTHRLASGGNDNKLLVWNIAKPEAAELVLQGHKAAVKGVAWSPHQAGILLSGGGSKDTSLKVWNTINSNLVHEVVTGSQVCSMVFSKTVNEVATGHGFVDNQVIIWKVPTLSKVAMLEAHMQRVLYLTISPNGQYIASGSGDQTIKIWDAFPEKKKPTHMSTLEFSNMLLR